MSQHKEHLITFLNDMGIGLNFSQTTLQHLELDTTSAPWLIRFLDTLFYRKVRTHLLEPQLKEVIEHTKLTLEEIQQNITQTGKYIENVHKAVVEVQKSLPVILSEPRLQYRMSKAIWRQFLAQHLEKEGSLEIYDTSLLNLQKVLLVVLDVVHSHGRILRDLEQWVKKKQRELEPFAMLEELKTLQRDLEEVRRYFGNGLSDFGTRVRGSVTRLLEIFTTRISF
jgi:hypothetical protein